MQGVLTCCKAKRAGLQAVAVGPGSQLASAHQDFYPLPIHSAVFFCACAQLKVALVCEPLNFESQCCVVTQQAVTLATRERCVSFACSLCFTKFPPSLEENGMLESGGDELSSSI